MLCMIELKDVSKTVILGDSPITILQPTSLVIKDGDYMSIVGPSGSGKSTLMNMIGLLDKPSSGLILVDDIETSQLSDTSLSRLRNKKIGFVFQQFNLIPKLTIRENIMLPGRYDDSKPESYFYGRAQELMERFGIAHRSESYPNKISGGEQQRTAISRSLIMDPEVILADEPTGNLDTKSGDIVLEILDALNKNDKKTIVVVTHELEVARRASRSVTIRDGFMTVGRSKKYAKKKS